MDNAEHVYCTDCLHFRLCDEGIPYCPYENKCSINNCDDSEPFYVRPYYEKYIDKMTEGENNVRR